MCVVYRAHRTADPTDEHALKVLVDRHDGARERFLDEGRMLESLVHPNLVRVQEVVDADEPWMVMELLAGKDLEMLRDDGHPLEPETVARWMADVARGLQLAHDRGIVHRDIKPSNLMLAQDGIPHLIDFGIARQVEQAHRTRAGVVMGTASYLPPEVFLEQGGNSLQDRPTADVYALGQCLCELLAGRAVHPAEEIDGPHMLVRIMKDKVARPNLDPREWSANVPDDLAEIVVASTRQDPTARIQTAGELAERLEAWLQARNARITAPVSAAPTTFPSVPSAPPPAAAPDPLPPPDGEPLVPGRVALGLGAFGMLGITIAGLVLLVAGGIGTLWYLRPDPAVRLARAAVQQRLFSEAETLRACVTRRTEVRLDLELRDRRLTGITLPGAPEAVQSCVAGRLSTWTLDAPDARLSLDLTLLPD